MVVWSMDVENMHPSLKTEEVSKLVRKALVESDLGVEVNDHSMYLALTVSREELARRSLTRVVHTRKAAAGAAPGITTAEVFAKQNWNDEREGGKYLFNPPKARPTRRQRKNMDGLALEKRDSR